MSASVVAAPRGGVVPRTAAASIAGPAVLIGILATALSVIGSWTVSLWTDEAATISAAERSIPQLIHLLGRIDAVHGTYYFLMHFWIGAFGASPLSLRLPSAIITGVAAAGTVVLAQRLADRRVAVVSGLVFCILPRVTWMGIEARSFAFSAAVAVWLTIALVAAVRGSRAAWVVYAVLAAVGIAINIYVALLLVAHAVTLLFTRTSWRTRLAWLVSAVIGALLASPIVYLSLQQKGQLQQPALGIVYFLRSAVVNDWFLGETPTPNAARTGSSALLGGGSFGAWQIASVLLAVVGWALIIVAIARSRHLPRSASGTHIPIPALILPWMLIPVIVVGAYSFVSSPIFNPRYFTFAVAPVAIGIGAGIVLLGIRWLQVVAGALIVLSAAPIYLSQRTVYAKSSTDWSAAAAFVDAHKGANEGVYFSPSVAPAANARVIQSSMRRVAIAYPGDFTGLVDVTKSKSPAASSSLFGESVPLADVTSELSALKAVWVIRPVTYAPGATRADTRILNAAGLQQSTRWAGPTDTVTEYTRAGAAG